MVVWFSLVPRPYAFVTCSTKFTQRKVAWALAELRAESLHQPIASFYSFGDRFVKYTLTTPEAEPAVELHSPMLRYGLVGTKRNHLTKESKEC